MSTKNKLTIVVSLIVLIGIGFFIAKDSSLPENIPPEVTAESVLAELAIENILSTTTKIVPVGTTALDLLLEVSQENSIPVQTKTYTGLGTLVEAVSTTTNGMDNKYWHYYINGLLAPIGADSYEVKDGDSFAWRFHLYSE